MTSLRPEFHIPSLRPCIAAYIIENTIKTMLYRCCYHAEAVPNPSQQASWGLNNEEVGKGAPVPL